MVHPFMTNFRSDFAVDSKFDFEMTFVPEKPQACPTGFDSVLTEWDYQGIYTSLDMHLSERTFKIEGVFTLQLTVGTEMVRSSVFVQEFDSALQSVEEIRDQVLILLAEALAEAKVNYDLVEGAVLALKDQGVYENHAWYAEDRKWIGFAGGRMRHQWKVQGNKLVLYVSKHGVVKGLDGTNYPPTPITVVEFELHLDGTTSFELALGFTFGMSDEQRAVVRNELDTFQFVS